MVLIHTGELPHQLQFVCPMCEGNNHDIVPDTLANLSCAKCGIRLDGSQASIEIIPVKRTAAVAHYQVPRGLFVTPALPQ